MKGFVRSVFRRAGYDIVPRSGPHLHSSMERALSWLGEQGLVVRTVLDVGASDGRWSGGCMATWPDATYVLFEPNPVHLPGIERFQASSRSTVLHVASAVSDTDGEASFDVSDDFGGALLETGGGVRVPTVTLDRSVADLGVEGPFLLKLDTHGFEAGIIAGASSTLAEAVALVIEAYAFRLASEGLYFWELCARLGDLGFRPVDIVDVMHRERDGCLWQMDLVFLRDDWEGFAHGTYR